MIEKFRVEFLEEVADFIDKLDEKTRDKVIYNIQKARYSNNPELFKKLKDEIWEFRTLYNKSNIRLLAFWDKTEIVDIVVITTNGFVKKTSKTPINEIDKAERLRKLYLEKKIK